MRAPDPPGLPVLTARSQALHGAGGRALVMLTWQPVAGHDRAYGGRHTLHRGPSGWRRCAGGWEPLLARREATPGGAAGVG